MVLSTAAPGISDPGQSTGTGVRIKETREGFQRASVILGMDVKSARGETLGVVKELIFSNNGDVEYIVVDKATLGRGGKLTPIPFSVIQPTFTVQQNVLVVSLTAPRFENAPAIDEKDLANIQNPRWSDRVHGFFGSPGPTVPAATPFVPPNGDPP
jgi:sporulation protein YlmC with PRC-barrel domain